MSLPVLCSNVIIRALTPRVTQIQGKETDAPLLPSLWPLSASCFQSLRPQGRKAQPPS